MSYRPTLREFIGQGRILKQALAIITLSIWSILLRGPYGYGKTELARILAAEGPRYCETRTKILSYLEPHDQAAEVPFEDDMTYTVIVDECHLRANYEWLYGAMEVNNYIFCSNMASNLSEPFINRCFTLRLDRYTEEELIRIIGLHSQKLGVTLDRSVVATIAQRSRGTPRTAIFFMRKYLAMYHPECNNRTVADFFHSERVDRGGLTELDRKYLGALETGHKSKRTLQMLLAVDPLELDRIEQYLIHQGMVAIESRGRRLV